MDDSDEGLWCNFSYRGGTIDIGNNVFIGENATILRNVKIGNNVVIGAGAVVTGDIEDDSVYAGVPARKIMTLKEYSERLQKSHPGEISRNIKTITEKKGRQPLQNEMMNFCFDFIFRDDAGKKSVLDMSWIGCNKEKVKNLFENTTPNSENFDDFLKRNS